MIHRMYQSQWQGISFEDIEGGSDAAPVGAEFYEKFYRKLEEQRSSVPQGESFWAHGDSWIAQKRILGQTLAQVLIDHGIAAIKEKSVLSLGAGQGISEESLLAKGFAVDLQECQAEALRKFAVRHPDAKLIQCDARALSVGSQAYDAVYCGALDYAFSPQDYSVVVSEMRRVLKPGGVAIVASVSNLGLRDLALAIPRKLRAYLCAGGARARVLWGYQRTLDEHVGTLSAAGLCVLEIIGLDNESAVLWRRAPTIMDRYLSFANAAQVLIVSRRPI